MTAINAQPRGSRLFRTDAARWEAVLNRDSRADAEFCYSVTTTGVYCLPSCTARRPLRRNVRFHACAEDAEKRGFRACKRCSPNGQTLAAAHTAAVMKACRIIETSDGSPPLSGLAKTVGMSRFHFHRVFQRLVGVTPKSYADAHRARRLRTGLSGGHTVTGAIYGAGFNSAGRFYAQAARMLGMTPTTFRDGARDTKIRFAIGQCSLGAVLVAATPTGICTISLGDDPDALLRDLQNQFRNADFIGGDSGFEKTVSRVIGFIDAPHTGFTLPLDIRGTAFQQRVWQALQQIPAGSKLSYTELAERIGAANAVRAVASACASNVIAVAIPCHRVVRRNGDLCGYRWGVDRKRKLLEREAAG